MIYDGFWMIANATKINKWQALFSMQFTLDLCAHENSAGRHHSLAQKLRIMMCGQRDCDDRCSIHSFWRNQIAFRNCHIPFVCVGLNLLTSWFCVSHSNGQKAMEYFFRSTRRAHVLLPFDGNYRTPAESKAYKFVEENTINCIK